MAQPAWLARRLEPVFAVGNDIELLIPLRDGDPDGEPVPVESVAAMTFVARHDRGVVVTKTTAANPAHLSPVLSEGSAAAALWIPRAESALLLPGNYAFQLHGIGASGRERWWAGGVLPLVPRS